MSGPFDPQTLRYYADHADAYLASRPLTPSRQLPEFLARLPPSAFILELGCGHGIDAQTMLARGFRVDPTDGVAEIAAAASKRLGVEVRVLRFDQLDAEGLYEAVWANASLHHVPRGELPGVLRRIYRSLKPGGFHFANYKSGELDARDDKARYYNFPTLPELVDAYRSSGQWEIMETEHHVGDPAGPSERGAWLAVTTRKPSADRPPAAG